MHAEPTPSPQSPGVYSEAIGNNTSTMVQGRTNHRGQMENRRRFDTVSVTRASGDELIGSGGRVSPRG